VVTELDSERIEIPPPLPQPIRLNPLATLMSLMPMPFGLGALAYSVFTQRVTFAIVLVAMGVVHLTLAVMVLGRHIAEPVKRAGNPLRLHIDLTGVSWGQERVFWADVAQVSLKSEQIRFSPHRGSAVTLDLVGHQPEHQLWLVDALSKRHEGRDRGSPEEVPRNLNLRVRSARDKLSDG